MAIVINGDGTVTGISVGGLPDGIVDSGTLADGTIANIDIGSLAASKLTGALPAISGASLTGLTSTQMPSGSIVQVVESTWHANGASIGTSSDAWQSCGHGVSITPVRTGSRILFTCTGFVPHVNPDAGGNNYLDVCLYQQVASGGYTKVEAADYNALACGMLHHSGTGWIDFPGHFEIIYTPSYTAAQQIDFIPYFRRGDTNAVTHYFHHSGGSGGNNNIRFIAMEIAG